MQSPRIRFKPVELKARHDGWTAARQFRFIELLAATRSVTAACRAVGMSRESAYALRDRPEAKDGFAFAWRRALEPDFVKQAQRRSPRALLRLSRAQSRGLRRLAQAKPEVHESEEMDGPPN